MVKVRLVAVSREPLAFHKDNGCSPVNKDRLGSFGYLASGFIFHIDKIEFMALGLGKII